MPTATDAKSTMKLLSVGAGIIFAAIIASAAPYALSFWVTKGEVHSDITLPLLAISGVSVLLVSLALVSISFATFGLSDKTQALGLPEGSIRAVIALSLLVIFAIVAFSLFASLSAATKPPAEAVDFAKQLLTLVGTLVTSLSSFYFGAKTATGAKTEDTTKSPSLRSVNPSSLDLTKDLTDSKKTFTVAGDNLDLIKEAKIVQGNGQIVASKVSSNASEATFDLTFEDTNSTGKWDVVVTDGMGRQAKLPDALEIVKVQVESPDKGTFGDLSLGEEQVTSNECYDVNEAEGT